ncbi:hypothetical protein [Aeromicrobium sp. P5_D10]
MTDLRTLMHEAAGLSHDPTPSVADADLARARRVMRRRRAGRFGVGSTLVAAAAIGTFAILAPTASPTDPDAPGITAAAPPQSGSAIELVSYSGKQPTGYVLDMVPAGWQIRDDTRGLLTLAPKDAEQGDVVEGMTSLEGTIAVSTQSDTGVPSGVKLDRVQVGDQEGVIAHMKGAGDTRTLFVEQASGTFLVIQVWDGLGWGNQQIANFAESVHITNDAVPSVG